MKKTHILLTLSILPLGITPFIGSIINGNTASDVDHNSDTSNVENKINIANVIPANTDVGKISLLNSELKPTKIQILGAINMWIQDKGTSQIDNWHINQVDIDAATITTTGAIIKTTSWSPDYNSSTTNVIFAIRVVDKISLREALTGMAAGTGTINLNTYKAESLSKMTEADITQLLGDSNKVKLLKWLDGADLYSSALYINQISVSKSLSLDGATHKYKFSISTKPNSTVYTLGAVDVEFNLSKADISGFTLVKTLIFPQTPKADEVAGQFLSLNIDKLDPTKITADDLDVKSIVAGGTCTVEVKTTNPTYMTSTPISLTWTSSTAVDIATFIDVKELDNITIPKDEKDLIALIKDVNIKVRDWTAEWDEFDMTITPTNSILKARAGSLHFFGQVTFTYAYTDATAVITPTSSEQVNPNGVTIAAAVVTNGVIATDPGWTASFWVDGVKSEKITLKAKGYASWPNLIDINFQSRTDTKNEQVEGIIKLFFNGLEIGRTTVVTKLVWLNYEFQFTTSEVVDGDKWGGNSIVIPDNLLVGKSISIKFVDEPFLSKWSATFPIGDVVTKDEGMKDFVINYPPWELLTNFTVRFGLYIGNANIGYIAKNLTINPRQPKFEVRSDVELQPRVYTEVGAEVWYGDLTIRDVYDTTKYAYSIRLMDSTTKNEIDHGIFEVRSAIKNYDPTTHSLEIITWITPKQITKTPLSCYMELLCDGLPYGTPVAMNDVYLLCQTSAVDTPIVKNVPLNTSTKILEVSGYDIEWYVSFGFKAELIDQGTFTPVPESDVVIEAVQFPSPGAQTITKFEIRANFKKQIIGTYNLRVFAYCTGDPGHFPDDKLFVIHEELNIEFTFI